MIRGDDGHLTAAINDTVTEKVNQDGTCLVMGSEPKTASKWMISA